MNKWTLVLCVSTSFAALCWALNQPASGGEGADDVATFMQAKLTHSKNVLAGLATEDYDLIAKESQQLTLLSLDTDWQVLQTAEYRRLSLEFRKTSQTLTEAATNKNLDGATLAYVDMTLKCVQCHKYVRSVDKARL